MTTPLSSSRIVGTVVGQALTPGSPDLTTYALSAASASRYSINGYTGVVSVAGPLTVGADSFTVTATQNGISFSLTVPITIAQGTTLPQGCMTMTVATGLTNYVQNPSIVRTIGSPQVTGLTGQVSWTMDQNLRCPADESIQYNAYAHGYTTL